MPVRLLRTTLKDGTLVVIRAVLPSDKHLFEIGLEHLSDQSRYFRFLRPVKQFSDKELTFLTSSHGDDHVILGALDVSGNEEEPIGVVRYVRLPGEPTAAEIAVTVVDTHQGRGLGSLLIGALAASAVKHDIKFFVALVHSGNKAMLHVFRELDAQVVRKNGFETELRLAVHADPALYPDTLTGDAVRRAYASNRDGIIDP